MLKSIIIDDERSGREILATMLQTDFSNRVSVVSLCKNIKEGLESIHLHSPDVIFLDIEMPNGTGFELVEKLPGLSASIVFVTAYNQYAVNAFRVNALDYLLKPVQKLELAETIQKVEKARKENKTISQADVLEKLKNYSPHTQTKIGLPSLNGLIFVEVKDIIRCEADDNYTSIIMQDQKFLVSRTLKEVEESLKSYNFLRVHKSHLVNLDKVVKYLKHDGGTLVLTNNSEIPVGRQSKDELERRLVIL